MFGLLRQTFEMLDNFGPHMRTAPAPYEIIDCEKKSAEGLTCNSVIMSVMEPPGNNSCADVHTHALQPACNARPLNTAATSSP
mmetsp:Transcript_8508/g.21247  ORF Transcript_8508/g.21247 Transcript_8508/m.21247 type:complete len:83 (-) Transcript_8508:256-504(-)